jgi:Co/Zn/Cd efflux system component
MYSLNEDIEAVWAVYLLLIATIVVVELLYRFIGFAQKHMDNMMKINFAESGR